MKTTNEIPDDLPEEAGKVAVTEPRFTLRDAGVDGRGVRDGVTEGDWGSIRETIYRER
jgi:hypothetical protein